MSSGDSAAPEIVAQLAAASGADLEAILESHPELCNPAAIQRLIDAAHEKLRANPQESLRVAEAAVRLASRVGDLVLRGKTLRAQANASWFLNWNREAVELYDQAAALFREAGDRTELGRTFSSSIQPLIRLGDYTRALEGARQARDIFLDAGDRLRLARLDLNVANILHRQDRFAEALETYERAYEELLAQQDKEGIAVALHNIAVCLIVLNDFDRALVTYRRANRFFEEHGMPALMAQADYNIAYLYYFLGDYSRALDMLRDARAAAAQAGDAYHVALCAMDRSEIYLELNMNEEAAESAAEAFAAFQDLSIGYEAAKSQANLAIAEGRLSRTDTALQLFAAARSRFLAENNPVWPWLLDLYQAMILYDAGRLPEAAALCDAALPFFRDRKMATKEILCELLSARVALRQEDFAAARRNCVAAMRRLEDVEAPQLRCQAHLLMGRIEECAGDFSRAFDSYREARSAAESLRSILRGEELKIAFMKGNLEIYERLVRLSLKDGPGAPRPEEAFSYMEQAKSRALRDLLIAGPPAAAAAETGGSDLAGAIRRLREELNWYYHRIESEEAGQELPSAERTAALRADVHDRERKLIALLREAPPAEAEQGGIPASPPLTLDTVRAALGDGAVLVEYFRIGDEFVAAVLTRRDLAVVPLAGIARIRGLSRMLQFQLSKFRLGREYVDSSGDLFLQATTQHLRDLYQELLAPLEPLLTGSRLVFVPHESLHGLPLHALYDGERYVADRFAVSYAPSAAVYALSGAAPPGDSARPAGSLVLGVPDPRAPLIRDEAEAVAAILPDAELRLGADATRQVLEERGAHARWLHIATHGRFRRDHPMFSAISLGDGYLTLYDLYRMRLPVDLATLSGCSTGLNVIASGDELLGLVRGLLHAGARALLLSLWDVNDGSTAAFMKSFYTRYVADPARPAEALRETMREIRETRPHPYYWAPFVLIGRA